MIQYEIHNVNGLREIYDPKVVDRAAKAMVNKLTGKARTLVSRETRNEYSLKAKDIAGTVRVHRKDEPMIERILLYTGGKLSLMRFDPKEVRVTGKGAITTKRGKGGLVSSRTRRVTRKHRDARGVSVLIKKSHGRQVLKGPKGYGGFLAMDNGRLNTLMREKSSRIPLLRLKGPSVPSLVGTKHVIEKLNIMLEQNAPIEFDRAMIHFLGKAGAQ